MLNFLSHPSDFNGSLRYASFSRIHMAKVAIYQLPLARTAKENGWWIVNVIKSGVAKVKNFAKHFADGFYELFNKLFVKTPVIKMMTRMFHEMAYKRLLSQFYALWETGVRHKKQEREMNTEGEVKRLSSAPYEVYVMGYEGRPISDTRELAEEIIKRELGVRTMSLMMRETTNLVNPILNVKGFADVFGGGGLGKGAITARSLRSLLSIPAIYFQYKMIMILSPYFLLKFVGPVVAGALLTYNPKQVFWGESPTYARIRKFLVKGTSDAINSGNAFKKIPPKDVYIHSAVKGLTNVLEAPEEEVEEIVDMGKHRPAF